MQENLYTPDCIRTVSGRYINVFEPTEDMINIEDIAHALSNQCRFSGHLPTFYSVAQHCLHCATIIDKPELKLAALLHDASEAYLLDIPTPIKRRLSNYREIEDNLMQLIARKFGFEYPLHPAVKAVDKTMLEMEWDLIMLKNKLHVLKTHDRDETKSLFLSAFKIYSHLSKAPEVIN